jgi:hypothetical protein
MPADSPDSLDFADTLRRQAWDLYFASAVSMSLHPGTTRENTVARTREQCAQIADEMLSLRDRRVTEGAL